MSRSKSTDGVAPETRELRAKLAALRALLEDERLDAIVLRRSSSFAWATCGAPSYVSTATDLGEAALVVTPSRRFVVTSAIEAPRFERELGLAEAGWTFDVHPWFEPRALASVLRLPPGARVGSDFPGDVGAGAVVVDLSRKMARLRASLCDEEMQRMRELCARTASAVNDAMRAIRRGMREHEIAAAVAAEMIAREVWPVVLQVACDERARAYKHALPAGGSLERYALVGVCGRRLGLVCSMSRAVHAGPLSPELRRAQDTVMRVDAAMIAASIPGATLGAVLAEAQAAYASSGAAEEWERHHQGGLAGYEPREEVAVPGATLALQPGHALAWNPTLAGAKCEDTVLLQEHGHEIATRIEGWPTATVDVAGQRIVRPDILIAE